MGDERLGTRPRARLSRRTRSAHVQFRRPAAPPAMGACVICGKSPRRAFSLPCGHAYCDTCAAAALWDSPRCVRCGAAASSATCLSVDAADTAMIRVRHRGVTFSIGLAPADDLHLRVGRMFDVPLDRLKLISQGKVLTQGQAPPRPGTVVQLIGTRQEKQLHGERRAAVVRRWAELREWAEPAIASIVAAAHLPTWQGVRRALVALGRGCLLFFASLLPEQVARTLLPASVFPDSHHE